jgi:phage gp29-like protein
MLELLTSMVQDGVGVIPDDGSIEFKESATKGATADLYRGIIAEANSAISTIWLGHAGAGESVPGQLGGKDVSGDVREDLRDADKSLVEETLNELIRWICEVNWPGAGDLPKFSLWEEEEVDQAQAERDKSLSESMARSGLQLSRGYYLREYNLEEGDVENVVQGSGFVVQGSQPQTNNQNDPVQGSKFKDYSHEPRTTNIELLSVHHATAADPALTSWVEQLRGLLNNAADLAEMRDVILTAYPDLPLEEMARIMAEEAMRANMAGRLEAVQGSRFEVQGSQPRTLNVER